MKSKRTRRDRDQPMKVTFVNFPDPLPVTREEIDVYWNFCRDEIMEFFTSLGHEQKAKDVAAGSLPPPTARGKETEGQSGASGKAKTAEAGRDEKPRSSVRRREPLTRGLSSKRPPSA